MSAAAKPPDADEINYGAIELAGAGIKRWSELVLEELQRDLARLPDLDFWDQMILRAKWWKHMDLVFATETAMEKYETKVGQLDLLAQTFGDQIGLPAQSLAADLKGRLEWYKMRIASEYERTVKQDMNVFEVTSPIEQIFLMEWRYLRVDERHGVKIRPQNTLTIAGATYKIDFVVSAPSKKKIAIEIDGHEFHERTKEQAAHDRARERKITREGYTILRFTGSEIFQNPRACVLEVVGFLTVD